mgnify:FL=1
MQLDIENIIVLQIVMEALSKGIDPTSNIAFPDDTILNSKILKNCFRDASKIFELLESNIDVINNLHLRKVTNQKLPFRISRSELDTISVSHEPVTISKFVYSINEACQHHSMKKLKATQITAWLTDRGYLEEVELNHETVCKSSTACGREIGITSVKKTNSRGDEYITNIYDRCAQEFILTTVLPQIVSPAPIEILADSR